ncbi:MAG: hypothetical protein RLZ19_124, partial [Actinomycetota bacterium]
RRNERSIVRTQTRKEWKFLTAHQHVDRVDLNQPDVIQHLAQVTTIRSPRGSRVGESLSGQCDAASLLEAQLHRLVGHEPFQSATVMVTELMTTSVRGRSPGPVGTFCMASTTSSPFTTLPNRA